MPSNLAQTANGAAVFTNAGPPMQTAMPAIS